MKLIFVYNVDSDLIALIGATAHKLVSPKTYVCNLCRLTYPFVSMNKEWRKFLLSLPYEVITLHRDEFNKQYPNQKDAVLPALFVEDAFGLRVLVSTPEINKARNIKELEEIILQFLPTQKSMG